MIDKHTAPYYQWGNQCDAWVLVDTKGLSVKQESIPSGEQEKRHYHSYAQQFFFILHGIATFHINEEKIKVSTQQGILIPAGIPHCIMNETNNIIDILVISQPTSNQDRTIIKSV